MRWPVRRRLHTRFLQVEERKSRNRSPPDCRRGVLRERPVGRCQQRNSSHMADRDHYATNKPSRVVPPFHLAAAWSTTSATIHTNAASWTEKKVERTAMAALEPEARCALVCTTRAATTPADNTSSVAE